MASAGLCCSNPEFLAWRVLTKTRPCWCAGLIDTLYERLLLPHKWRSVSAKAMLRQQRSQLDCHRDNECPFAWFQMVETPASLRSFSAFCPWNHLNTSLLLRCLVLLVGPTCANIQCLHNATT